MTAARREDDPQLPLPLDMDFDSDEEPDEDECWQLPAGQHLVITRGIARIACDLPDIATYQTRSTT
jgi:hypothetical protein